MMETWSIEGGADVREVFNDFGFVETTRSLSEILNRDKSDKGKFDLDGELVKFNDYTSKLLTFSRIEDFFVAFQAINRVRTLIHAIQEHLIVPQQIAEMAMVVSANRIEGIRRIQMDLVVVCNRLNEDLDDRQSKLYDEAVNFSAGADPTVLKGLGEKFSATILTALLLPRDEAHKYMLEWGLTHIKPAPWTPPPLFGQPGTFDLRGILDYDYMIKHGYDKLTEEQGINIDMIKKTETIRIGEGEEPREDKSFVIWGHDEIALNKEIGHAMNEDFVLNNQPILSVSAIEDLFNRQSSYDRTNKVQHKAVQQEKINRGTYALDTMTIKRPLDLWRYKEVYNAYVNATRLGGSAKDITRTLLEHKLFSGYDCQESEIYDQEYIKKLS
jgi:hypothetical protein